MAVKRAECHMLVIQNQGVEHFKCGQSKISYADQMDYSNVHPEHSETCPTCQNFLFMKIALLTEFQLRQVL